MPAPSTSKRKAAEQAGRFAEFAALVLLMAKGYRILSRRFVAPGGEIDLVARRGTVIVFIEVKFRKSLEEARLAVTPQNQSRIKSAADTWLARRARNLNADMRYDIVALSPRGVNHIRDAFR